MSNKIRKCKFCGKEFYPKAWNQCFCSPKHLAKCEICGKDKLVKNANIYQTEDGQLISTSACSQECIKKKTEITNLKKYGTTNVFSSEYCKQKIKETNLEKYGVEHIFQKDSPIRKEINQKNLELYGVEYPLQSKEIQEKIEETNLEKLGVRRPFESQEIQEKIIQNNLNNYGVRSTLELEDVKKKSREINLRNYGASYPMQSDEVKEKAKQTNRERYGTDWGVQNEEIKAKIQQTFNSNLNQMENRGYVFSGRLIERYGTGWFQQKIVPILLEKKRAYVHKDYIPIIEAYFERNPFKSNFEQEVGDFIESLGIEIQRNNRSLISPLEIDIYIPEKNLAIECDGMYWHSTNAGVPRDYHLRKTELCIEKGIRLIHINEWEWTNKQEVVKSIIRSALGIYSRRIYARNCEVKELSTEEARKFLEDNHLQGHVNSSIKLGLYYKDELVQAITLGKSRFKSGEFELLRMAASLDTQIIGGFSKLLAHISENITEIISYVDRSKFTGRGYINSGWQLISTTNPGYSYFRENEKLNRIVAQKHKLAALLGEENFDPNLTESENMIANRYFQVYDCGNLKMRLVRKGD